MTTPRPTTAQLIASNNAKAEASQAERLAAQIEASRRSSGVEKGKSDGNKTGVHRNRPGRSPQGAGGSGVHARSGVLDRSGLDPNRSHPREVGHSSLGVGHSAPSDAERLAAQIERWK